MRDLTSTALDATRRIRSSRGYGALDATERTRLDRDLHTIESALAGRPAAAQAFAGSLADDPPAPKPAPPPPPPPAPTGIAAVGQRTAEALAAVNFPGFVAGLIQGVFQAIVDASAQQVREYAALVASLSRSLDTFSSENVSPDQARDWLAQRHGQDLRLELPAPGQPGGPRLLPRASKAGTSPEWLADYDLAGEDLDAELTEGPLLAAGRLRVGEERLQSLATMVLMGINRVVVSEGDIRAKLQFHAVAREQTTAEMTTGTMQAPSIAGRSIQQGAGMVVSTMRANAQADASVRADLMGEVRVSFKTETFPLERFADSAAIQLLNRHARWQQAAPAPAPGPTSPAAPITPPREGT